MQLLFAAALLSATWLGHRWCARAAAGNDAWAPIARGFPLAAALVWAYIATAVASSHTWRLGLPGASEVVLGAVLVAAGLAVFAIEARRDQLRAGAGVTAVLAGIALIGDSGYGLLLAAAFALLVAVVLGRRATPAVTPSAR